jgi:restriction system protein
VAGGVDGEATEWREELLEVLLAMHPAAFERLAELLLKAAGFIETDVTGRSGDGGIDGTGVYRISLVSFPVYFQCKRWRGGVGPEVVREFRGAIAGRGDRGLLITTGKFTPGAIEESKRERERKIELIDGRQLCDLLKKYGLGVKTEMVERVEIHADLFESLGTV